MSISSSTKFSKLSKLFEKLSKLKKSSDKQCLLKKFFNFCRCVDEQEIDMMHDSLYGILRLLLPQCDKKRHAYGLGERSLARVYCQVLSIGENSEEGRRLLLGGGGLPEAAYTVLNGTRDGVSVVSVEDINTRLDNIANASGSNRNEIIKENLIFLLQNSNALDQKWFIQILLKNVSLGMTQKIIFKCFHPCAEDLYNVTNDLEVVCTRFKCYDDNSDSINIQLCKAFKPMLSERGDIKNIVNQLNNMPYIYETKFDGERVQLHKDGDTFRYWSRNGLEWTKSYGLTSHSGTLTPYIINAFLSTVNNCILDGEMMGYNNMTKSMGSKAEEFDIKNINVEQLSGYLPCFIIFDVLYLNDEILTEKRLVDRKRILDTQILQSEIEGKIQISKYTRATTRDECLEGFNGAIERCDEGLMVKRMDSTYKINSRKAGWFKLKPDYVLGLHEELDCVIVGGYFTGGKIISHFLCAVKLYSESEDRNKYFSFCKVGSGFTRKVLYKFNLLMASNWKSFKKENPPDWLILSSKLREKPDIYIDPCNSYIVELKAAEIISSENYATKCTLRFSRINCFREDKSPVDDCMTLKELEFLRSQHKGKLALHSLEIDSEEETSKVICFSKKQQCKRRHELTKNLKSDVPNKQLISDNIPNSLFNGKEFSILVSAQCDKDFDKKELERLVYNNGGIIVQNPSTSTHFVITDKSTIKIQNLMKTNLYDIIYVDWLIQCIKENRFIVLKPSHYLSIKQDTKQYLKNIYDQFGDSYADEVSCEELKQLLCNMEKNKSEFRDLSYDERSFFIDSNGFDSLSSTYLNGYVIYFQLPLNNDFLTPFQRSKINRWKIGLKLAGANVEENIHLSTTHVVMLKECDVVDIGYLNSLNRERNRKFFIVSSDWVVNVLDKSSIVPESTYIFKN